MREVDKLRVKGKALPVAVYEILDAATIPGREDLLGLYQQGLGQYRTRDFHAASQVFSAALAIDPGDGPSRMYQERCAYFVKNPPPVDWDGVWTMTDK